MKLKSIYKKLLIFLTVLGPSVITTMAGNDGGGVITYSVAGAKLGYAALYTLPFLTLLYGITQEMGSRIAIVTGKGLGDLIREIYGVRTAFVIFILLIVANFGSVLTNVAAVKTSSQLLGLPAIPTILAAISIAFIIVTATSYEKSQKIFLTGIVFYLAYVFSAVKSTPNFIEPVKALYTLPNTFLSKNYLIIAIAIIGTTITPWGQFFVQSYMKDKNISTDRLGYAKIEAFFGAFLSDIFSFFIIIATASTLFINKIPLESGEQAALAIKPFAGELASILFSVGLFSAAIIGMVIVSLTSSYAFTEFFGFAGSLDEPFRRGKVFYLIFLFTLILSGIMVTTPYFPLFKIVIYTQSLNGILLPVFFFYVLKVINSKSIMGKYTNGKIYNILAISATLIIITASIIAISLTFTGLI